MSKKRRNICIITILFAVAVSLCACGGLSGPGSKDEGAVSGSAVSGAAVSGSAVDEKADVTKLRISVGGDNPVVVPDPADAEGEVDISLQEELYMETDDEDDILDEEYEKQFRINYRQHLWADLSFAGFENEVLVTSFAVGGNMAEGTPCEVQLHYERTGKDKKNRGNCLALHVVDVGENKDFDADGYVGAYGENTKNYLLVIDYANRTYAKTETDFFLHSVFSLWNDLRFLDLTGDGLDELMIQHCYNKSIDVEVHRYDPEIKGLKEIYSTWDDDNEYFSGHLEDDYKVVMEYKDIGFSETVSMLDAGYEAKYLEISGQPEEDDEDTFWMIRLWKDKKLKKQKGGVFLYSLGGVKVEEHDRKTPQLVFEQDVCVGHRSFYIGFMDTYFQYDEEKDALVLTDAKFEIRKPKR